MLSEGPSVHITVFAAGSRGDTQPYLALALGFRRAGHQVRVVAVPEYASLIEGAGVEYRQLAFDPRHILGSEQGKRLIASGNNPFTFLGNLRHVIRPVIEKIVDEIPEACRGSDALLMQGSMGELDGPEGIQPFGLPMCSGYLWPATPTREFPMAFFPELPRGLPGQSFYNRLTYVLLRGLVRRLIHPMVVSAMSKIPIKLTVRGVRPPPLLYGFSPSVVLRPPEWSDEVHVTGYWFLETPASFSPQPKLADFLAAGPSPVYVGFGGAGHHDPVKVTEIAIEALKLAGRRGILMVDAAATEHIKLPDFVLPIESVPHDWLFPKMAAVVHHGGAGTTAAVMKAGVPSIVIPFTADQPFWGRRIHALGVGHMPIPRRKLIAHNLADAIKATVGDRAMRERAAALGALIRAEDGVGRAVEIAVRYFEDFAR
jgi:sterol 3beta-glucosyltransferase